MTLRARSGPVLKCNIIGVLEVVSEAGKHPIRNDRIIAVPRHSHREQAEHASDLAQAGPFGNREILRCNR